MTLVSLIFFSSLAVYLTRAENIANLPAGISGARGAAKCCPL